MLSYFLFHVCLFSFLFYTVAIISYFCIMRLWNLCCNLTPFPLSFLERLVCLILNLCHFCVISRWCYRSHHLHPGVLYKRECLLHCHLPRGHHSGHPAPAQHEESGDGGQVRFFCLFCFQRNLTPWCKSDVLRAALLPVISTSDEACTGYQCKIRSAHSERFAIGTVRNFKKLTHLSF